MYWQYGNFDGMVGAVQFPFCAMSISSNRVSNKYVSEILLIVWCGKNLIQ